MKDLDQTNMRRGIDGLSALVEAVIKEAPESGAIFDVRGKRSDRIKLLWWATTASIV
ncbi:transposase (plasmid) [Rhizobium lusitanum]|uniref:IS66 family insertion sequence element accessory protein TnpB n=1 Tax=Rhizobium lusitanum TaxID=293958 RepID=UPI00160F3694|nr:IS66 family insertion sequence element accessory protein TnpB [Rhizobium lusitanum]QND44990.1 transposase [Rhizobium lusitanum]